MFPKPALYGKRFRRIVRSAGLHIAMLVTLPAWAQVPDGWDWAMHLVTPKNEFAYANAVDSTNRMVYTAGGTVDGYSSILGVIWEAIFGANTQADGYLCKQDLNGNNKWQFVVGGSGDDAISGVCVDPAGNVYVTGWFTGNNASFKGVSGSNQTMSSAGQRDIFVARYSPAGILQWKMRAGGPLDDVGTGICHASGRIFVTGRHGSSPGLPTMSSNTGESAFLFALDATNGNLLWSVFGNNGSNTSFNAVAADDDQVYAIGTFEGTGYTYYGTTIAPTVLGTAAAGRSAHVLAMSQDGTFRWADAVSNPGDDQVKASGIAASAKALYISGSTHNNSIFPGGVVVNDSQVPHDHGYLARLDKGDGGTQWVRTFSGPVDHAQVGLDLAVDSRGDVLMSGTYNGSTAFSPNLTLSTSTGSKIFLVKFDNTGTAKWAMAPTGNGTHIPYAVATDGAGKVCMAGSYTKNLTIIDPWSDGNSLSLFMATLSDLDYDVQGFHDPSAFDPFGPVCETDPPIDLTTLLIPRKAGPGASVVSSSGIPTYGIYSPGGALGQGPGGAALFDNPNDVLVIDMGDTIPVGEQLIIRWRRVTAGSANLNVQGSLDPVTGYTNHGTASITSTSYMLTGIMATAPMRYVKLTRGAGAQCAVDAVFYCFGSDTDGTWTGDGVSGHTFDPSGLTGEVSVIHSAQGRSTTRLVQIDESSVGGNLTGGGMICPGSDANIILNGSTGSVTAWHWKANNASTWNIDPSGTDTYTLASVTLPTQIFAEVVNGACPAAPSDTIVVLPQDNAIPVFIHCPNDTTVYAPATACDVQVAYIPPEASDNCDLISLVVEDPAHQPGQFFPLGTTIVRYIATDQSGNAATCEFTITVLDTISPSIICPAPITTSTNAGCTATGLDLGTPVASDNCMGPTISNAVPTSYSLGTNTVIWTATDASGNTASCSQIITVIDDQSPTIICPGTVEVFADAGCSAVNVALGSPIVADNCMANNAVNDAPAIFPIDTTIVTWTVADGAGNLASCTQKVVVIDNIPPTITCPAPVTVSTNVDCGATGVALGSPVASDNCGYDPPTNNAPATFALGTTPVVWTVVDRAGLQASCTQAVTVIDDVPPAITCPDTLQVFTNAACSAINVALGAPVSSDNCGVASVTNDAPAAFPLHETVVTWTVTDNSGNTGSCEQVVEVIDNMPPTITCPGSVITSTNNGCTAEGVALGSPVANDHCGTPVLTNDAPTSFPLGITTVTWTATDGAGNASTCTQTITVIDNTPPVAQCKPVTIVLDNNGIATVTPAQVDNGSSDNCAIASITLTNTAYYAVGTYTDTLIVVDDAGNSDSCFATITVVDQSPPTAICNDQTLYLDADGDAGLSADDLDGGSFDNGEIVAVVASQTFFTCADLGNNAVTLTVTDDGGNSTFCVANVTVLDTIPPQITCPGDTTLAAGPDCSISEPVIGSPVVIENCTNYSISSNTPIVLPLGTSTITWNVTDAGGNSAQCTQEVSVVDLAPPVAKCKPVSVALDDDGVASVTPAQVDNGSSDNCTIASITLTTTAYYAVGTYTDTLIVVDAAGNSDTCFAMITVVDQNAPTAICNDLTLYLDAGGNAGLTANDLDGGSFDNGEVVAIDASQTFFTCADLGNNAVTLTVTDDGGNSSFCVATVTVLDTIAPNTGGSAMAGFCLDAPDQDLSSFITEVLATSGSWTTPNGTVFAGPFSPASDETGMYLYTAPSLAGCGTDTFRVEVEVYPLPFAGHDTSLTLCSNDPGVDLFAMIPGAGPGGTWSIGTGLFDPAAHGSGIVQYIVTGDHGCTPDTAYITATVVPAPNAGTSTGLEICMDAAPVDLFALLGNSPDTGGWWSDPDGNLFTGPFDPAQHTEGDYVYTVDGSGPCASTSATIHISKVDVPSAAWTSPPAICANAAPLDLTPYITGVQGGTWSGTGITNGHFFDPQAVAINGSSAEVVLEYSITVAGCSASTQGNITVDALPVADAGNDASVCSLEHTLMAVPTYGSGTWSTPGTAVIASPGAPNTQVASSEPGQHPFFWTVVNGSCSASDSVHITFHLPQELTLLDAGEDQLQDINTSMELNGRADGATESWWSVISGHGVFDDANALATRVRDLAFGDNLLVLSARVGSCPIERDTVRLTVRGLLVPTGFSPNGDGVNDIYTIRGLDELPPISLYVYDRWGNQVFHSDHYRNEWAGEGDNGQPLMDGTYFGILTIAGQEPWKGNITLKR